MTLNLIDITPVSKGVPRSKKDQPYVIPKAGGKPIRLTRTTTFIDCIEDKSNLADWGKRMVLLGVTERPSLLQAVKELDPEDVKYKRRLNALAESAVEVAGAHDRREAGSHLHALSEYVDAGKPLPERTEFGVTTDADLRDMMAYMAATLPFTVKAVEQFCVQLALGTGGTYDRILHYAGPGPDGKPIEDHFIGDLKTGSVEYGALKMASQLAVYSRAELYDWTLFPVDTYDDKAFTKWKKTVVPEEEAVKAYTPIAVNQDWGIIINLPSGSGQATLHWADLTMGWEAAQEALVIRALRSGGKKALRPFDLTKP